MTNEEALKIYKTLSQPPKEALKVILAGDLKGKSDINPQWRYEAMTKAFGLVGIGWKYEIQRLWTEPGANGEILAFAQVAVYVKDGENWSDAIIGVGGSKLINSFSKGLKSNDEGFKMAITDAFSTSLKMLGVAADVYAGRWDGSKYLNSDTTDNSNNNSNNNTTNTNHRISKEIQAELKRLSEFKNPSGENVLTTEELANLKKGFVNLTPVQMVETMKTAIRRKYPEAQV